MPTKPYCSHLSGFGVSTVCGKGEDAAFLQGLLFPGYLVSFQDAGIASLLGWRLLFPLNIFTSDCFDSSTRCADSRNN